MSKELYVEVISPEGYLFDGNCHMSVIPSVNGEMGILTEHELVLARLQSGKVKIYSDDKNVVKEIEIQGGFAKLIRENRLLILVDG